MTVLSRMALCLGTLGLCAAAISMTGQALAQDDSLVSDETEAFSDPQVRVCPNGKYESGCDREDISNAIIIADDFLDTIDEKCLFQTKARCFVTGHGFIAAGKLNGRIAWQHLDIYPKDGPRIEMLVMAETSREGPINLVTAHQTEGWYGVPDVIKDAGGLMLIHAPGRTGGTGAGNVDVVLTRHKLGWTIFDVNSFLEQAEMLLPKGFTFGRGANFNFREMTAVVPVSREGDGGCCSTGGMAFINLGLPRDNWMQVDSITFEESQPVQTHRVKATESIMPYDDDDLVSD